MIALMLAAVAASAAPAAGLAVKPPPPIALALPVKAAARMKALGMSDAGIAVLRRQSAPDPYAKAMLGKRQALRQQLTAVVSASPFDIDAFAGLLRESSTLEETARERNEERIVTTLKALPPADRAIFAKVIVAGPQRPTEAPPPPPARPQRPTEAPPPPARPQP